MEACSQVHGDGLGALVARTERARIGNGGIRVARIFSGKLHFQGIQGFA